MSWLKRHVLNKGYPNKGIPEFGDADVRYSSGGVNVTVCFLLL